MRVSERVALMLREAVERVASEPERCARSPGRDFTRSRKLPLAELLWLLVTMGTDTLGMELLRRSGMSRAAPSVSALCQQWAKLADAAPRLVLDEFLSMFRPEAFRGRWRLLAVDGTDLRIAPDPSDPLTRMPPSRGLDGRNEVHLTCAFDPMRRTFEDMVVRGGREKDEFAGLCELVDRRREDGLRPLWVADRGFCSYNVLAHMALAGASYVIRASDSRASAILGRDVSAEEELDEVAELCIVRTGRPADRTRPEEPGLYRRLRRSRTFDPLPPGSPGEFWMGPRVVRVAVPGGGRLNLVTDLPAGEFGAADLAALYRARWDIETAFDELKHVVGLECPHVRSLGRVAQEAWARLVLFDACSLGSAGVPEPEAPGRASDRTVSFKLVMALLRGAAVAVEAVCERRSQPVRPGRSFRRRRRPQAPPSFSRRH